MFTEIGMRSSQGERGETDEQAKLCEPPESNSKSRGPIGGPRVSTSLSLCSCVLRIAKKG